MTKFNKEMLYDMKLFVYKDEMYEAKQKIIHNKKTQEMLKTIRDSFKSNDLNTVWKHVQDFKEFLYKGDFDLIQITIIEDFLKGLGVLIHAYFNSNVRLYHSNTSENVTQVSDLYVYREFYVENTHLSPLKFFIECLESYGYDVSIEEIDHDLRPLCYDRKNVSDFERKFYKSTLFTLKYKKPFIENENKIFSDKELNTFCSIIDEEILGANTHPDIEKEHDLHDEILINNIKKLLNEFPDLDIIEQLIKIINTKSISLKLRFTISRYMESVAYSSEEDGE